MIRFQLKEYLKNIWFNVCFIIIIIFMMICTGIFLSNVDEQTKLYRLTSEYIDDDSVFINITDKQFVDKIDKDNKYLISKTISGDIGESKPITMTVYPKDVIERYPLKIEEGEGISNNTTNDGIVEAVISKNPYGIGVGDIVNYNIYMGEKVISVKIVGILLEGQRLFTNISKISNDMTYEDFFPVYSYEQTGEVRLFISESEQQKISGMENWAFYENGIVNPNNAKKGEELYEMLVDYEKELFAFVTADIYPKGQEIITRSKILYKSIVMKYIPIVVFVVILFLVCIIGVVMIKVSMDLKYYGILSLCGMSNIKLIKSAVVEMLINVIVAFIFSVNLINIQNKFEVIGKINCSIDALEILVMFMIGALITVVIGIETYLLLRNNTIIQITKNNRA